MQIIFRNYWKNWKYTATIIFFQIQYFRSHPSVSWRNSIQVMFLNFAITINFKGNDKLSGIIIKLIPKWLKKKI